MRDFRPRGLFHEMGIRPRSGVSASTPHRREETVGTVAVRPQAQVAGSAQRGGLLDLLARQHLGGVERLEVGVGLGEGLRDGLVLGRQQAAGGVDELAARLDQPRGAIQDRALLGGTRALGTVA